MIQSKAQKLKQLRKRLSELEDVKLREALSRYGEAYQESGGNWNENAAWELADEEVSVLRAMITEIKKEIHGIEHPTPIFQGHRAKSAK
ncbi:MAG: hypothetical protein UT92_C0002G0007 [Candidatus Curtissbacteria bacterium GW2011_GWA1_40_24]|uniref:Uncharacterized protein n=1 Tax=Candidatus Curtissbacteria bacterium GW2011_GWA1_40_24 TaxID=1618406 RepID=A0A0G0RSJ3_9BACT|nr:MAG: hypothetical protein UT92_C0002G0007 [Candidatus Curtissbacteria bacterium GW2011_GWA1_40_24]